MQKEEIIKKISKSWNLPCIIITKNGNCFLASPLEFIQEYLRYGIYNTQTFEAANGDDYMMLDILSDQMDLSEIDSVVSWEDLKIYVDWIRIWEDANKQASKK